MSQKPTDRGGGLRTALFVACGVSFVVICALSLRSATIVLPPGGDSEWFLSTAETPLGSISFWRNPRPWGYPLLLKLCGLDSGRTATAQFVLHLVAHLLLAFAMFRAAARSWLGLSSAAGLLLFATSPHLTSWTLAIMSESMALSMTAVFLASLLFLVTWLERDEGRSNRCGAALAAGVVLSAVLLGGTRDNWPFFFPLVAAALVLPLARRGQRASASRSVVVVRTVVAVLLIATFSLQLVSARKGQRWRMGMSNVVLMRVLPHEQVRRHWEQAYGLPVDSRLMSLSGRYAHAEGKLVYRLGPFQNWLEQRGVRSYATYLVSHPLQTVGQVLEGHRETRDWFSWEYTENQGDATAIARAVKWGLFHKMWLPPGGDFLFPIILLSFLAGAGPPAWRGTARVLLLLALYLPFQSALSYLSDANEIYRHALPVSINLRLLGWLAAVVLGGALIEKWHRRMSIPN